MFWNDICEIKSRIKMMEVNQARDSALLQNMFKSMNSCCSKGVIPEQSELDEVATLSDVSNRVEEVLDALESIETKVMDVEMSDKLLKYMDNVERLNTMVNEIKGVVSVFRGNLAESKSDGLRQEIASIRECFIDMAAFMDQKVGDLFDMLSDINETLKSLKKEPAKKKVGRSKKSVA